MIARPHILFLLSLLTFLMPFLIHADPPGNEPALGPLEGRNLYAAHLPWYSFTGGKAAALPEGSLRLASALYYINEINTYPFAWESASIPMNAEDQEQYTAMDYESAVWEVSVAWQAWPRWRFTADWRLHARYGGVFDAVVEGWHSLFGFPNGGREYFDRNRSYWNIRTADGSSFGGSGFTVASGDLDLGAQWTLWESRNFAVALNSAVKVPLGAGGTGFHSGYPDLAVGASMDWRPLTRWAFYLSGGVILPTDDLGSVMGQAIPAVEFRVTQGFSILVQANIQTSPIQGHEDDMYWHPLFGETAQFALAQTDLKVGFRGQAGNWSWQFYFEEDPVTWEGPDIMINIRGSYDFRI